MSPDKIEEKIVHATNCSDAIIARMIYHPWDLPRPRLLLGNWLRSNNSPHIVLSIDSVFPGVCLEWEETPSMDLVCDRLIDVLQYNINKLRQIRDDKTGGAYYNGDG